MFGCSECGKNHDRIQKLDENIKMKVLKCSQCEAKFRHKQNRYRHAKIVHEKERVGCKQCVKEFVSKQTLDEHIKTIHEGVKSKCNQCEKNSLTLVL